MAGHLAINYKTETDNVLGELPEGFLKMPYKNTDRFYFVHHATQTTTWIDPRTKNIRKSNLNEVKEYELPYGWEEICDSEIGIYYADHITKKNYTQGPWNKEVCKKATEDRAVFLISKEKERTVNESPQLNLSFSKTKQEQAQKEKEELATLKSNIESEKEQEAQKTIQEMESVRLQLELESQKRIQIEQQIMEMKEEIIRLASVKGSTIEAAQVPSEQTSEQVEATQEQQKEIIDESESLDEAKSQVERLEKISSWIETEKEKIISWIETENEAKSQVERLEKIISWIETEKEGLSAQSSFVDDDASSIYQVPPWLANLDRKTIRERIRKALPTNPDELEFVQKVFKFEVEALSASEGPKLPSLPSVAFKNEFTIKPKETGFADITSPTASSD